MPAVGTTGIRRARTADAPRIARLHADSWRRHYRGAYSDAFLDGEVELERLQVWSTRLRSQDRDGLSTTILAEERGSLVGFVHVVFDDDPTWGSLVDNLHVTFGRKRSGIGSILMVEAAREVGAHGPGGIYLWVLEQNIAAQGFYESLGGRRVERTSVTAPGGDPIRLEGEPFRLRYTWACPAELRS